MRVGAIGLPLAATATGLWLMAAPALLGYGGASASHHHILGPVILTIGWIACSDVTRAVARANLVPGVALVAAPLVVPYSDTVGLLNGVLAGALVVAISISEGRGPGVQFGGGWRALWHSDRSPRGRS